MPRLNSQVNLVVRWKCPPQVCSSARGGRAAAALFNGGGSLGGGSHDRRRRLRSGALPLFRVRPVYARGPRVDSLAPSERVIAGEPLVCVPPHRLSLAAAVANYLAWTIGAIVSGSTACAGLPAFVVFAAETPGASAVQSGRVR